MIRLVRTRTKAAVPASLRGDKRRAREAELVRLWRDHLQRGPTSSPKWKTAYWKAGKSPLRKDSAGKCAYCESPTDVVAHGDVEHFRPKSIYWWLAYCLDNHLFACQICNETYKGDHFPVPPGTARLAGPNVLGTTTDAELALLADAFAPDPVDVAAGYTLLAFVAACEAELAGLPHPYMVDPEPFFKWEADATNKEVWVRGRSNTARNRFVFESAETYLGLNREELRRWRWTLAYKQLAALREILRDLDAQGIGGAARQRTVAAMKDMMGPDQPYAAMVRYFVNDEWGLGL
jgi:hypothetical protein